MAEIRQNPHHRRVDVSDRGDDMGAHYRHARELAQHFKLSLDDIEYLTPAFWQMHSHDLICRDSSAATILTIHYNLCVGTLSAFRHTRSDVQALIDELMGCRCWGEFMLTEYGHGLDAKNLQTTATLLDDGRFDLHTPSLEAAKVMPPSTPVAGEPKIALVFARLIVGTHDRGIRAFIVPVNDGVEMTFGIVSQALPPRAGATPLDHAITYFHHVVLPTTALLGDMRPPLHSREHFLGPIHRVTVGSVALTMTGIPALRQAGHILTHFSRRRTVEDAAERCRKPIIAFRTQLRPIALALAQAAVYEVYAEWSVGAFMRCKPHERYTIATVFKATVSDGALATLVELTCRLGWRGQFRVNRVIDLTVFQLANSVAEGDITALCVRLANEILLDKYRPAASQFPQRPLAIREQFLVSQLSSLTQKIYLEHKGSGRPPAYNANILPWSKDLIVVIGQRMAVEAALMSRRVAPDLVALYENDCLLRSRQITASDQAVRTILDDGAVVSRLESELNTLVSAVDKSCVDVPILSKHRWAEFGASLQCFGSGTGLHHHGSFATDPLRALL